MEDFETTQRHIRAWLNDPLRRDLISITAIERQAKLPASTLRKFVTGNRWLPYFHQEALINVLKILGYTRAK